MSKQNARIRIAERILFFVLLAPILLLASAYLEFTIAGTHRIKEALHVDQVLHALEASILHR
jgi:hypothetical protein